MAENKDSSGEDQDRVTDDATEADPTTGPTPPRGVEAVSDEAASANADEGGEAWPGPLESDTAHDGPEADAVDEADASAVYTFSAKESAPGDPTQSAVYSPGMEETWDGPLPARTSPKVFGITAVVVALLGVIVFTLLPASMKADTLALLQGRDIIEEKLMREQALREAERQAILDAAPKYGTIEIVTIPNNLLVAAEGQPLLIFPGSRRDLVVPTRSRVIYQDISVTEPFVFTIHGEGVYQDRRVTIEPFGHPDSEWVQRFSGEYTASVTYTMEPLPDAAREVAWRRGFRPADHPGRDFLKGTITLNTEPPGAAIAYNGILLLDANGNPATTPFTFSQHPAPANAEDQSPRDVYLSREGMRVELLRDGYVRTAFGVHAHQFTCTPKEGAAWPAENVENADFYDLCDYTYEVTIALMEPPPEEEETEEGEQAGDSPADGAEATE